MFGWFKRKSKVEQQPLTPGEKEKWVPPIPAAEPSPATAQTTAAPVPTSATVAPVAQSEVVVESPDPVAPAKILTRAAPVMKPVQRGRKSPIAFSTPGEPAVHIQLRRRRPAEIVKIQGNGRRVLARLADTGRIYAFTLRPDGSFRLEQAPAMTPTTLISVN